MNIQKDQYQMIKLEGKAGVRLSLYTGMLEYGYPDRWSVLHFYHAMQGSFLHLKNKEYEYIVATYSLERDDTFLYTYSYQQEENWTAYNQDMTAESYRQTDYIFEREVFFRINIRRRDNAAFTEEEKNYLGESLEYYALKKPYVPKHYFEEEILKTSKSVKIAVNNINASGNETRSEQVFLILTDSHYVVNGTWKDTIANMQAVARLVKPDGVIHLGDMTDGMVSREVTRDYIQWMMEDMRSLQLPVYAVLGNHDSNYFRNNPDKFSEEEQYELYLSDINKQSSDLYYFEDMENIKVRFIFLHSFDYRERVRYGFGDEEAEWLGNVLCDVPEDYRVLVFSHVPPLPVIHFWSDEIRNGEKLVTMLEQYGDVKGGKVLGWIHGHNHAEQVYRQRKFPIISLGCNKCEYYPDKKPENAYAYKRRIGDVTQDLWDILIINRDSEQMEFIRFGAGEDRKI